MHLLYIDLFLAAAKNPVNLVQMRRFPNVLRGPSRLGRQQKTQLFWSDLAQVVGGRNGCLAAIRGFADSGG